MQRNIEALIDADDAVGLRAQIVAGLSPNLIDATGESPLSRAAAKGSEAVVKVLLDHGAVPDAFGVWPSPLALAAEAGVAGIVERLLAAGADVGSEPWHEDIELPLVAAFFSREHKIAETLIERGAVEAVDERFFDDILKGALGGRGKARNAALAALVRRLLVRFDARPIPVAHSYLAKAAGILEKEAGTRDLGAALRERVDTARAAVDRVSDWADDDATPDDLLEIVRESPESVRAQVAAAAFMRTVSYSMPMTRLPGHEHLAQAIFDIGIDANYAVNERTPLMEAALCGATDFVEKLLAMGAEVRAMESQSQDSVVDFARDGCDPATIVAIEGALRASAGEYDRQADLRLERLEIAERNAEMARLAVEAAAENRWDRAEALMKQGADVNGRGRDGRTLVMYAARQGDQERVRWLVESGAALDVKCDQGRPVTMCGRGPSDPMVHFLKSLMSKTPQ